MLLTPRNAAVLSPDCMSLATTSERQKVHLWDTQTGEMKYCLGDHPHSIWDVVFSSDGETVATICFDHTIRFWNTKTGAKVHQINIRTPHVGPVALSPRNLVAVASFSILRLWDARTSPKIYKPNRPNESEASEISQALPGSVQDRDFLGLPEIVRNSGRQEVLFSPDGQKLVSTSLFAMTLWDRATGQRIWRIETRDGTDCMPAFSQDSRQLASRFQHSELRLVDLASGQEKQRFNGHTDVVTAVAFSFDGKTLASVSNDRTIRLWDVATGDQKHAAVHDTQNVSFLRFTVDDQIVLATGWSSLRLLNMVRRAEKNVRYPGSGYGFTHTGALSSDSSTVASLTSGFQIHFWNLNTGDVVDTIQVTLDMSQIKTLSFFPDNRFLRTNHGLVSCFSNSDEPTKPDRTSTVPFISENWVFQAGTRTLWIPPEYRPYDMDFHDGTYAWVFRTNRVIFIGFNFEPECV
jgi:WD40 repeat protein